MGILETKDGRMCSASPRACWKLEVVLRVALPSKRPEDYNRGLEDPVQFALRPRCGDRKMVNVTKPGAELWQGVMLSTAENIAHLYWHRFGYSSVIMLLVASHFLAAEGNKPFLDQALSNQSGMFLYRDYVEKSYQLKHTYTSTKCFNRCQIHI